MKRSNIRRLGAAALAAAMMGSVLLWSGPGVAGAATGSDPSHWRTWVLASADQFRLPAPPARGSATTRHDLNELEHLQSTRTRSTAKTVHRWNSGPATVVWTKEILKMILKYRPSAFPTRSARALTLLHVGMYDAMVAAWDSRDAYERARPAEVDHRLDPLLEANGSSYPDVRTAIAGAAESLLAYLFPQEPAGTFTGMTDQIVRTRLLAGVNYRSDLAAARSLGHEVAGSVIAFGDADGHQVAWNGTNPVRQCTTQSCSGGDEQHWVPTPPIYQYPPTDPTVSGWKTWLLSAPGQLLPDPPPAFGSPQFMDEVGQVKSAWDHATDQERASVVFWDDGPGTYSPAGHWNSIALDLVRSRKLNTQETARVFATLNTATWDAFVAAWNAKYTYWSIRPVTVITERPTINGQANSYYDPNWQPALVTPPFPSYVSGHATVSGAASRVLQWFFPDAGQDRSSMVDAMGPTGSIDSIAEEVANSRLVAGIHFSSDNAEGLILGRKVARLAILHAEADGSGL